MFSLFGVPIFVTEMASSSSIKETTILKHADAVKFSPEQVTFKPCNFLALVDLPEDKPQFLEGAIFIKSCPLKYAFLHQPIAVTADLQAFWYSAHCSEVKTRNGTILPAITFQLPEHGELSITTGILRRALRLPNKAQGEQWESVPTPTQITDFLDSIGYAWEKEAKVLGTTCHKNIVCARWQYIFTQVIQCLGSKSGSQDQASKHMQGMIFALCTNYRLNFAEFIFSDLYKRVGSPTRKIWVSYPRFVATIINYLVGKDYTTTSNQRLQRIPHTLHI